MAPNLVLQVTQGTQGNRNPVPDNYMLYASNQPDHKIIIADKTAPICDLWRANAHLFQEPVFASTGYCPDEGSWKFIYTPKSDDHGTLLVHSTVCGEFACVFNVFIHHELKLCAIGNGYIEMDFISYYENTPDIKFEKAFETLRDIPGNNTYDMCLISDCIKELWPGYRSINWSSEFLENIRRYHEKRVNMIYDDIAAADIKSVILEHALPKWFSNDYKKHMTRCDLYCHLHIAYSWRAKWMTQRYGETEQYNRFEKHTLPHRWHYWYVMNMAHVIAETEETEK